MSDDIWIPVVDLARSAVKGFPENKAGPYAASRDFINAILCEEAFAKKRPILSNKNSAEDSDEPDAEPIRGARTMLRRGR